MNFLPRRTHGLLTTAALLIGTVPALAQQSREVASNSPPPRPGTTVANNLTQRNSSDACVNVRAAENAIISLKSIYTETELRRDTLAYTHLAEERYLAEKKGVKCPINVAP